MSMAQLPLFRTYVNVSQMEDLVLSALARLGPMTPDEIAEAVNLPVTSIRPRVTELLAAGRLVKPGWRRPTAAAKSTGRQMTAAVVQIP